MGLRQVEGTDKVTDEYLALKASSALNLEEAKRTKSKIHVKINEF